MTDEASASATGRGDRWDALAAVVLALSAVLSAWAAYQSTLWGGEQADAYATSAATRAAAARHNATASRQLQIDVTTFLDWAAAYAGQDTRLADFVRERFRPEFTVAFDAWVATQETPGVPPPGTPFDMPEYQLAAQVQADALIAEADALLEEARVHNTTGDRFVLVAVVFASVLFVAGIASRFSQPRIKGGLSIVAAVLFVAGMIAEFLLPQNLDL